MNDGSPIPAIPVAYAKPQRPVLRPRGLTRPDTPAGREGELFSGRSSLGMGSIARISTLPAVPLDVSREDSPQSLKGDEESVGATAGRPYGVPIRPLKDTPLRWTWGSSLGITIPLDTRPPVQPLPGHPAPHRPRRASLITRIAALRPGAPETAPPGWAPEPQRYSPSMGVRNCAAFGWGRRPKI